MGLPAVEDIAVGTVSADVLCEKTEHKTSLMIIMFTTCADIGSRYGTALTVHFISFQFLLFVKHSNYTISIIYLTDIMCIHNTVLLWRDNMASVIGISAVHNGLYYIYCYY